MRFLRINIKNKSKIYYRDVKNEYPRAILASRGEGSALFMEDDGYGRAEAEIAVDGENGIADCADMLNDCKPESGASNALGM